MILGDLETFRSWGPHGQRILRLLAEQGPSSREQIHRLSGLHRNLIGDTVSRLIDDGLISLGTPRVSGRGRPQTPMQIDSSQRAVVGVSIDPGMVAGCKVSLLGEPLCKPILRRVTKRDDAMGVAAGLVTSLTRDDPLAVGVSITGVIDAEHLTVLQSSSLGKKSSKLGRLIAAAGGTAVVLENDLHALAQYWRMTNGAKPAEDVMLIRLEDGAVAAALLIEGKPRGGCVHAAEELGHTALPIETRRCYCGGRGCLERIFDSRFAQDIDGNDSRLAERLEQATTLDDAVARVVELTGLGVANAIQLTKPHRAVLVSSLSKHQGFRKLMANTLRKRLLLSLRERVSLEWWEGPELDRSAIAAYPAINLVLGERKHSDQVMPIGSEVGG